jgi:hypothetical protein
MRKVTIIQHDVHGPGTERVVVLWSEDAEALAARKSRAYNMDHTTITVG